MYYLWRVKNMFHLIKFNSTKTIKRTRFANGKSLSFLIRLEISFGNENGKAAVIQSFIYFPVTTIFRYFLPPHQKKKKQLHLRNSHTLWFHGIIVDSAKLKKKWDSKTYCHVLCERVCVGRLSRNGIVMRTNKFPQRYVYLERIIWAITFEQIEM